MLKFFKNFEQKHLLAQDQTELDLACFRALYSLLLAWRIYSDLTYLREKFEMSAYYIPHSFLAFFEANSKPDYNVFLAIEWVLIISLVILAIGVRARFFAGVACLLFTWSQLVYYSMHLVPSTKYVFHSRNIIVFILLGLAIIPTAPLKDAMVELRSRSRSRVLYSYVVILLCFAYSSALVTRILTVPYSWFSGEFLGIYLAHYGYVAEVPWAQEIALRPYLPMLMSWITSLFELFSWTLLISGRHRLVIIALGIVFHVINRESGFADFVDWFGFAYLIFIPYSKVFNRIKSLFNPSAA